MIRPILVCAIASLLCQHQNINAVKFSNGNAALIGIRLLIADSHDNTIVDIECPSGATKEIELTPGARYEVTFYNGNCLVNRGLNVVEDSDQARETDVLQTDEIMLTEDRIRQIRKEK